MSYPINTKRDTPGMLPNKQNVAKVSIIAISTLIVMKIIASFLLVVSVSGPMRFTARLIYQEL